MRASSITNADTSVAGSPRATTSAGGAAAAEPKEPGSARSDAMSTTRSKDPSDDVLRARGDNPTAAETPRTAAAAALPRRLVIERMLANMRGGRSK